MRHFLAVAVVCFAIGSGGCGAETGSTSQPASESAALEQVAGDEKLDPAAVNLVIGDEKKFAEMLAKHKGKVVFVDFWATWCGPCVEQFPHTVATHNKYKDQGLATIAVSFDLLDSEPQVREFLSQKKNKADFDNLLSNYDDVGQAVGEAFEFEALPELRLYDRTGKLRHEWTSKPEDLDQRIEELLAEKAE